MPPRNSTPRGVKEQSRGKGIPTSSTQQASQSSTVRVIEEMRREAKTTISTCTKNEVFLPESWSVLNRWGNQPAWHPLDDHNPRLLRLLLQGAAEFTRLRKDLCITLDDMECAVEFFSSLSALKVGGQDALVCQKRFPMEWGLIRRYAQGAIPASWVVGEGAWKFVTDRMGNAVEMMVAFGSETRERPDEEDGLSTALVDLMRAMQTRDQQEEGGAGEKTRGKRGHSPRSHALLEQMEESKKYPRREQGPGQE